MKEKSNPTWKVIMKSDSQLVDEVVIVGYGTGKKLGSVVGSVSTVSNKALEAKPTMNFADALQTSSRYASVYLLRWAYIFFHACPWIYLFKCRNFTFIYIRWRTCRVMYLHH